MHNLGRILLGLLLIIAGILFFLDLGDYVDAGDFISTWWPLAIVAFGITALIGPTRSLVGGAIVTVVGIIVLLATTDILPVSAGEIVLPVILIAVGLGLIVLRAGARSAGDTHNSVNGFAMFGGQDIASRADAFTGGSLTALFGGVSLDLRQAQLDPEGASVETFAAFGGIDVIVPRGWRVSISGMPLFGAFEDNLDRSAETPPDAPKLTVTGIVLFGGIEVTHKKED